MFLHIVATNVVTHFNDNDKGLKVYRQAAKKSKSRTLLMTPTVPELISTALPDWSSFWCYKKRLPARKKTFQKTQVLSVIKGFWRSHIHKLICFQSLGIKHLHDMNIRSVRVGRGSPVEWKWTPLKKFTKVPLTKKHLSVIKLDLKM